MKKISAVFMVFGIIFALCACSSSGGLGNEATSSQASAETASETKETDETSNAQVSSAGADINIAVLSGPTGIGAVGLMEANDAEETVNNYTFTVAGANDEVVAGLTNGSLDIAAVATNVAANLYNKTDGLVQICALNTYGVLYILENGDSVQSVADLKGRTVYATGQGANPEYVLEYILSQNGLTYSSDGTDADVKIEFMASDALASGMVSGEYDLCMLPVPAVTSVEVQNENVRTALDLTYEWDQVTDEGALTMGCVVVRTEFAEENPKAVSAFLSEYAASIESVTDDVSHAAELCEAYGIVAKSAIAAKAIPDCNICCVTGADEIKNIIEPYYNVLYAANPDSIGGSVPDEGFYFK